MHKLRAFEQDLSCIGALQMLIVLYCIVYLYTLYFYLSLMFLMNNNTFEWSARTLSS